MSPDDPDHQRSDGAERVEQLDVGHLLGVVWRWKLLVLIGVVLIVAATVALLRLTTPAFEASTVLVIEPATFFEEGQGHPTSQLVDALMPTYAAIGTSDPVLDQVRDQVQISVPLDRLRRRIDVEPVPDTFALRVTARDDDAAAAEALVRATAIAIDERLVDEDATISISPLLEPEASRPGRNESRTVVLAGLLGVAVMVGVAFFLEYVSTAPITDPRRAR